jgi:hypothetical protein
MNHTELIDKLLRELSYRVGIVDLKNKNQQSIISEILTEWNEYDAKTRIMEFLTEAPADTEGDDKDYTHLGAGIYVRKGDEDKDSAQKYKKDDTGSLKAISDDEYQKTKSTQGQDGEKAAATTPQNQQGGDVQQTEEPPRGTSLSGKGGEDYKSKLPKDDPASKKPTEQDSSEELASEPRTIAGKNKTLKKTNSLETETFMSDLPPSESEFDKKNEKISNPTPPEPYKIPQSLKENPKFPKKYLTALERMMNTKPTGDGTKWTHYSDIPGGAGQISAQAGELMTMMGTSMTDLQFKEFTDSLLEHETELIKNNSKLKSEGSRIVTKSWIKSAENNRQAILNRIQNEYPGSEVIATAWDTKDDVESLGLNNYEKNKGFSTDMYIKIRTKDGNEILDEVSLKKSTDVNFLNSGAGKFSEWDSDIPDEINQNVYRDKQRERLSKFGTDAKESIQKFLTSGSDEAVKLKKMFESKKVDFETALEDTNRGKGSRGKSKVILECIKALADSGDIKAKQYIEENDRIHRDFQEASVKAITENPKMKAGMLSEIRSEFPLKAVSDGEETMAIGPNSLDRSVMKDIFGTDDYDEIKEKLTAESGPPPFLGYQANVGDEIIPLAEIRVREDGVGYGGQIKFEMTLDRRFAKVLKSSNEKIYSK